MPLPRKDTRNKAIVALRICGFSYGQIGGVVGSHKNNVQMFVNRDMARYQGEIMNNIAIFMTQQKGRSVKNNKAK